MSENLSNPIPKRRPLEISTFDETAPQRRPLEISPFSSTPTRRPLEIVPFDAPGAELLGIPLSEPSEESVIQSPDALIPMFRGYDNSSGGLLHSGKLPEPYAPQGIVDSLLYDAGMFAGSVPAMSAGFLAGGGTPVTGTGGAFGAEAGMRQVLMDSYRNKTSDSPKTFFQRLSSALKETAKGFTI